MKVKIEYVVDVDDSFRRKINAWYGRPGLATHTEVKSWYEENMQALDQWLSRGGFYPAAGQMNREGS